MSYQGHKNWNHWNVSLWLYNDYALYQLMQRCVHRSNTLDNAAHWMVGLIVPNVTPDGAPYTFTSIRAALVGWKRSDYETEEARTDD